MDVYKAIWDGALGSERRVWITIRDTMVLLCIAIGLAPAFKMRFRNVLNKSGNKIKSRDFFNNIFVIFVSVVMKSHSISVIGIDSGSSNNRTSQVAPNELRNCFTITKIWFCVNIETVFTMLVNKRFHTFKRIAEFAVKFV